MDGAVGASALLGVTSSVSIFNSFLPPFSEVRKSLGEADMVNDVRMGEIASFALVVGIGATASVITKSPVPIAVCLLAGAVLVGMYETALLSTPKELA